VGHTVCNCRQLLVGHTVCNCRQLLVGHTVCNCRQLLVGHTVYNLRQFVSTFHLLNNAFNSRCQKVSYDLVISNKLERIRNEVLGAQFRVLAVSCSNWESPKIYVGQDSTAAPPKDKWVLHTKSQCSNKFCDKLEAFISKFFNQIYTLYSQTS